MIEPCGALDASVSTVYRFSLDSDGDVGAQYSSSVNKLAGYWGTLAPRKRQKTSFPRKRPRGVR